jgi:hypothetical protein
MTKDELIARIEEAEYVMRRLPDPERRFRFPKMSNWPTFVRDFIEAYGYGDVKMRLPQPTPAEITRAEEVLGWFATHLGDRPRGAKALWLTYGRGLALCQAGYLLGRVKKSQVSRLRDQALKVLLERLSTPSVGRAA